MNDDGLDALLREELLQPPKDFAQQVMKNLAAQIQPSPHAHAPAHSSPHLSPHLSRQAALRPVWILGQAPKGPAVWPRVRWLAARAGLVGGGLLGGVLGFTQLASFVLGVWLAGAAL